MKHATLGRAALALTLIAGGLATPLMTQASDTRTTFVVVNESYKAGNAQGRAVLDWITRHWPDYAPIGRNGEVRLERLTHASTPVAAPVASQSPDLPAPPGKLPDSGAPGEILRMENILPDGTTQTWEFRWVQPSSGHGGHWSTAAYSIRFPMDPVNVQ
ncbi:hypothetical protein KQ945_06515 [Bacillus subtilis subsp. subtilis]|nr:hypothetical protein [Bacillus subtilis subsp. subtilis]